MNHQEKMTQYSENNAPIARVIAVHKERYQLQTAAGEACFARLKASVYYHGASEAYPVTGDLVAFQPNPGGDSLIMATLPRRTLFQRYDGFAGSRNAQAVAANFDTVLLLTSANHDFNPKRLRRYLAVARQSGARYAIVITKADQAPNVAQYVAYAQETAPDCPVLSISAVTGQGLDGVRAYLTPGSVTVFLGSSGVGKSTLVNALAGRTVMDVNGIREDDSKGRHTTTHRQILTLDNGAMIMDTPGMRELGLVDAENGVGETFAPLTALAGQCRFSDCTHTHEPGCAVRAAIDSGKISQAQWDEYQSLNREASRKSRAEWIGIAKRQKAISKRDGNAAKGWED